MRHRRRRPGLLKSEADPGAPAHSTVVPAPQGELGLINLPSLPPPPRVTITEAPRSGTLDVTAEPLTSAVPLHELILELERREQRLHVRDALAIVVDLCSRLQLVADSGEFRDQSSILVACNTLVEPEGHLRLERIDESAHSSAARPRDLTPEERVGETPDRRSDVWLVATTLRRLLVGRAVDWVGNQGIGISARAPTATRHRLSGVLSRALDPNPGRRHPTPGALALALAQVVAPDSLPPLQPAHLTFHAALGRGTGASTSTLAPESPPDSGAAQDSERPPDSFLRRLGRLVWPAT